MFTWTNQGYLRELTNQQQQQKRKATIVFFSVLNRVLSTLFYSLPFSLCLSVSLYLPVYQRNKKMRRNGREIVRHVHSAMYQSLSILLSSGQVSTPTCSYPLLAMHPLPGVRVAGLHAQRNSKLLPFHLSHYAIQLHQRLPSP